MQMYNQCKPGVGRQIFQKAMTDQVVKLNGLARFYHCCPCDIFKAQAKTYHKHVNVTKI